MKRGLLGLAFVALLIAPSSASAAPIDLFQWVFNVDGTLFDSTGVLGSSALPANFSGTPLSTGAQGLITASITGAGAHSFTAFWDYELDETVNGFSNEYATVVGAPAAGLSWEVDEPGFVFGDIYGNIQTGLLDNTNAVGIGAPDDVSVALGWNFNLAAGETALISLLVSTVAPVSGFYIGHFDPGTGSQLFYSTALRITGGPVQVPEPGTLVLTVLGIAAFAGRKRLRALRSRSTAARS